MKNEEKKKNNKVVIIIVSIISLLIVLGMIIYAIMQYKKYYDENFPKLSSIEIQGDKEIKLFAKDTYDLEYKLNPENAKKVNLKTEISNEDLLSVDNFKIKAKKSGTSDVCIFDENNPDIKDCIKVTITTKSEEYFKHLDSLIEEGRSILEKHSDYVYTMNGNEMVIDFIRGTATLDHKDGDTHFYYVYHFYNNYMDGYVTSGKYKTDLLYNPTTNTLNCVGSTVAWHNVNCSYSAINSHITSMATSIRLFESFLDGYSPSDINPIMG